MVQSDVTKAVYVGDGVTTSFAIPFKYIADTDVKVSIYTIETGAENVLTKDYYVDTAAGCVNYPGYKPGEEPAESDRPPVLTAKYKLVVYRETPYSQLHDLGDKYPLPHIEEMSDKLTYIVQELVEAIARSVKTGKGDTITAEELISELRKDADLAIASASAAASSEANAASSAKSAAKSAAIIDPDTYLPLAGGTMTGNITMPNGIFTTAGSPDGNGGALVCHNGSNLWIGNTGAEGTSATTGSIGFYSSAGGFAVYRGGSTKQDIDSIVSKSLSSSGYIKYNSGLIFAWQRKSGTSGSYYITATKPLPFTTLIAVTADTGGDSAPGYAKWIEGSTTTTTDLFRSIYEGGDEVAVFWIGKAV